MSQTGLYVARANGGNFPACPTWCDGTCAGDVADAAEAHGIVHMRFYGGAGKDDVVCVEQLDTIGSRGLWVRGPATINLLRGLRPEEFNLRGLSPEQAYALADLVFMGERFACDLLDAVETLAPHLTAVPA